MVTDAVLFKEAFVWPRCYDGKGGDLRDGEIFSARLVRLLKADAPHLLLRRSACEVYVAAKVDDCARNSRCAGEHTAQYVRGASLCDSAKVYRHPSGRFYEIFSIFFFQDYFAEVYVCEGRGNLRLFWNAGLRRADLPEFYNVAYRGIERPVRLVCQL